MKRFLSVILTLIILLGTFSACTDNQTDTPTDNIEETTLGEGETTQQAQDTVKKDVLVLPYSATDSLNPYKAVSLMNGNIAQLLYDGLFKLDESYTPVKVLAESSENKDGYVTVTISDSAVFSDGKAVTASDVVHSFNTAKESEYYSGLLANFASATALDSDSVRFKLDASDPYAENCLTFPIIKYGQGEEAVPTGTGRYTYSSGQLKYNKNHISGQKASLKTIELYDIKDNTKDSSALQIGNISFMYSDMSDCQAERITAITRTVTLNNFVFLGMNGSSKRLLSDNNLRRIISYAIDKQDIAENAFQGYASVAETPFNPVWSALKNAEIKTVTYSPLELTQQLDKNGYIYAGDNATVRSKGGKTLQLKLLVNGNNRFKLNTAEFIQTKLKAIGIDTVIEELSAKELRKAIRKGNFDLYIGEIKLCENMSLSDFFTADASGSYGINKKLPCISKYESMLSGKADINEFITAFNEDMPFVPICYRQGYTAISNEFEDNIKINPNDVFENIYEWKFR